MERPKERPISLSGILFQVSDTYYSYLGTMGPECRTSCIAGPYSWFRKTSTRRLTLRSHKGERPGQNGPCSWGLTVGAGGDLWFVQTRSHGPLVRDPTSKSLEKL